jgi:hypothetical protein
VSVGGGNGAKRGRRVAGALRVRSRCVESDGLSRELESCVGALGQEARGRIGGGRASSLLLGSEVGVSCWIGRAVLNSRLKVRRFEV